MKNKVSAYNKSVEYLAQMAHTEFEIKRYLKKKYYEDAEIFEALELLKGEGVVDDKKYAKDFIEFSIRNRLLGPNAIRVRLARRGVNSGVISDTLSLQYPEELVKKTALASAKKKLFDVRDLPKQKKMEKIGRFLVSRGFSEGTVWETLESLGLKE
jgi:regulatory protein